MSQAAALKAVKALGSVSPVTAAAYALGFARGAASCGEQITEIGSAVSGLLDVGGGVRLWYRTWGNKQSGIPVLFVHGGPGNCVADYQDVNQRFFDVDKYWVVRLAC